MPHLHIANKMKKRFIISIGLIIGVFVSLSMMVFKENQTAHGSITWWDEAVAYGNLFEWSDVFGPSKDGEDLYKMVYGKMLIMPENDALESVAKKFALTKTEAQSVIDGGITALFNSPDRRSAELTYGTAFILYSNLQRDYEDLRELFDLEQEINVAIAPSELFSNGDLTDSGFDLVHDLSVIEEILFVDVVENTVGQPYGDALSSPYIPTAPNQENTDYIASNADVADLMTPSYGLEIEADAGVATDSTNSNSAVAPDALILSEDECAAVDPLSQALSTFEDEVQASGGSSSGSAAVGQPNSGDSAAYSVLENPLVSADGKISNAAPGKWGESEFCPIPGLASNSSGGNSLESYGFSSLGDWLNTTVFDAVSGISAGDAAVISNEDFTAYAAFCVNSELIYKTVSSFQPGSSCVACEVDAINELMNKTLSHSLIPNKVTGNIMESAKCKEAFMPLPDIQFITIAAPVATPPNDDLIFGNNIFAEWNSFVDRYHPFLSGAPQFSDNTAAEFELEYADEGTSISNVFLSVETSKGDATAEALAEANLRLDASSATDAKLYGQVVLAEIQQMNALFEQMNSFLIDIDTNACRELVNKPDLD
jgi:hypothetical protein